MNLLTLKNISKTFGLFKKKKTILKDVSFNLNEEEIVSIIGKNGAGKTTLLNIITNNLRMNSGDVKFNYKYKKTPLEKVAYVYQENKFPTFFKVKDFCELAISMVKEKDLKFINELKQRLNLDKIWQQKISQCSGGEKQKINLFSVLIEKPKIILLDEITNNLDYDMQNFFKNFLKQYVVKNKAGIIFSSHNLDELLNISNKIYLISEGVIQKTFNLNIESKEKVEKEIIKYFLG